MAHSIGPEFDFFKQTNKQTNSKLYEEKSLELYEKVNFEECS
jgi:hypothetical protein